MRQRGVCVCERYICIAPAIGQWAGDYGSVICMGADGSQWGVSRRARLEGDVSIGAGRWVTPREAGPAARAAGTCRPLGLSPVTAPHGTAPPRAPPRPAPGTAASGSRRGGKMSVAGLKKQFHKASQVRGAVPGAGAVAEPQGGALLLMRGSPCARSKAQRLPRASPGWWHRSLAARAALPSALPLRPPPFCDRLLPLVLILSRGLPVPFCCSGLRVVQLLICIMSCWVCVCTLSPELKT